MLSLKLIPGLCTSLMSSLDFVPFFHDLTLFVIKLYIFTFSKIHRYSAKMNFSLQQIDTNCGLSNTLQQ